MTIPDFMKRSINLSEGASATFVYAFLCAKHASIYGNESASAAAELHLHSDAPDIHPRSGQLRCCTSQHSSF